MMTCLINTSLAPFTSLLHREIIFDGLGCPRRWIWSTDPVRSHVPSPRPDQIHQQSRLRAAGMPAAATFLLKTSLAGFAFSIAKIVMWEQQLTWRQTYRREQQICHQIRTQRPSLCFSARKNRNAGTTAVGTADCEARLCNVETALGNAKHLD